MPAPKVRAHQDDDDDGHGDNNDNGHVFGRLQRMKSRRIKGRSKSSDNQAGDKGDGLV